MPVLTQLTYSKYVDQWLLLGLRHTLKVMYRPTAVLLYHTRHKNYDTLGLQNVCCVSLTILEVIGYTAVLLIADMVLPCIGQF